jgi:hypothetical protein
MRWPAALLPALPVVEQSSRAKASARSTAAGNNNCNASTAHKSAARQRRSSRAMASFLVVLSVTPQVSGINAGKALIWVKPRPRPDLRA